MPPSQPNEDQNPIEIIHIGDKVLAQDPATSEQGYFEVVVLANHQLSHKALGYLLQPASH